MTALRLRKDYEVRTGRWQTLMVGSASTGVRVVYDITGECIRLYGNNGRSSDNYLDALPVKPDTWEAVAHAYFKNRKIESPWEVAP